MEKRGFNLVIVLFFSGLILLTGTFYTGLLIGKKLIQTSLIPTPSQTYPSLTPVNDYQTNNINPNQPMLIHSSFDRRYFFYLYPAANGEECEYGLIDKEGYSYDLSKQIGSSTINCSFGEGLIDTSFMGWTDSDRFLIKGNSGEIKIIDVTNMSVEIYRYDTGTMDFVGVDRLMKYFLFRKTNTPDRVSYTLLDNNKNVILANIDFVSNDRGVLYDEVNNGFLFISRTYIGETVSTKFDFLPMNNLTLGNILTTEPVVFAGRGCIPEYLISQPGKIILTQGCLTVGKKYLDKNGNISIPL